MIETIEVQVYYRTDREGLFFEPSFSPETFTLDYGYSFDVPAFTLRSGPDQGVDLELFYRMTNRVDGSAVEVVPSGQRSLSVGDVLVVGEAAHYVASFGFGELDTDTLTEAIARDGDPELTPRRVR